MQPSYPGRPDYLAFGDSVAFGFRPVTSAATYLNPANFIGYPEDVAKALRLNLANASCPGETTSSMINTSAPSNGCETLLRSNRIRPKPGQVSRTCGR